MANRENREDISGEISRFAMSGAGAASGVQHSESDGELSEREERFRLVARATNDVIWDWNLVTNEGWRNDTFQTRFGYASGRLKTATESWYNGIHPQDKERVIAGLRAAIDSASVRLRMLTPSSTQTAEHSWIARSAAPRLSE